MKHYPCSKIAFALRQESSIRTVHHQMVTFSPPRCLPSACWEDMQTGSSLTQCLLVHDLMHYSVMRSAVGNAEIIIRAQRAAPFHMVCCVQAPAHAPHPA